IAVPSPPRSVTAVLGNGQSIVTWSAPDNDGGSPVTGYTVTASPGGRTATTQGTTTATVTGLTNGTAYQLTVTAANAAGTSAPSAVSAPVTPATTPSAPLNVTASAGESSAKVSWAIPTDSGGAPITKYTVVATPGGQTATTTGATTATVTGLTNGIAYT